jgi:predicted transglutaminase-like cysteine proteinase
MVYRVAAWSVAVFLIVSPAASGIETDTLMNAQASAAATAPIAMTPDQTQDRTPDQTNAGADDRFDARPQVQAEVQAQHDPLPDDAGTTVAALDPVEPKWTSPTLPTSPAMTLAEPFGLDAVPVEGGEILTKWSGVEADIRADNEILARCRENAALCPTSAQNFLAVVAQGQVQSGRSRIGVINRAINLAIEPMSDLAQWGVPDRWSSPLETFTTGRGDCEDYAIAKYVALTAAGVAAEDVRLVIIHDVAVGQDHAIVATRLDGKWIMLDNRWLRLVVDADMRQIVPMFVLDGDGVRQFASPALSGARRTAAPAALGL